MLIVAHLKLNTQEKKNPLLNLKMTRVLKYGFFIIVPLFLLLFKQNSRFFFLEFDR